MLEAVAINVAGKGYLSMLMVKVTDEEAFITKS
jgi:hypothetical protein